MCSRASGELSYDNFVLCLNIYQTELVSYKLKSLMYPLGYLHNITLYMYINTHCFVYEISMNLFSTDYIPT